ncbi:hypothetical protein BN1221_03226c [Brenneria goodwinii]|uniref:Uncharacterized protein n=1 Tax=Brenneria goodwinii TaxID=1109412 RepID=A0A0G4JXW2_9GAMM|nr:hypothetical protein BN1221_03226c [Brenneria goodwinii]
MIAPGHCHTPCAKRLFTWLSIIGRQVYVHSYLSRQKHYYKLDDNNFYLSIRMNTGRTCTAYSTGDISLN